LLAVQGVDDEFGTMEQMRRIGAKVPGAALVELEGCGHSPHRDRADIVLQAISRFVRFAGQ
jgi:pimeloyl-ACP methyl ester carboxylesterase